MPWLLLDVIWILLFAAIGRQSHAEQSAPLGILATAGPFLAGYAVAVIVLGLPRRPLPVARGVLAWLATVLIGLAIRTVLHGQPPAVAFIIVALIALGLGLVGWRSIAALVCRRRRLDARERE